MDRIEELETALEIESATADHIRVDDVRRLTGPGLLWDRPGAVVDVFFEDVEAGQVDPFYAHTIWKDGVPVGIATSGAYGHRTGKVLALAYLRDPTEREGLTISILGQHRAATILAEAPFDPNNHRLKTGGSK